MRWGLVKTCNQFLIFFKKRFTVIVLYYTMGKTKFGHLMIANFCKKGQASISILVENIQQNNDKICVWCSFGSMCMKHSVLVCLYYLYFGYKTKPQNDWMDFDGQGKTKTYEISKFKVQIGMFQSSSVIAFFCEWYFLCSLIIITQCIELLSFWISNGTLLGQHKWNMLIHFKKMYF